MDDFEDLKQEHRMHHFYGNLFSRGRKGESNLTRRDWLERMLAMGVIAPLATNGSLFASSTHGKSQRTKWSMPGLFPGKVVSVHGANSMIDGSYQAGPVRDMIRRGMVELTGAPDWVAAWGMFFEPGEVIGLKLNPSSLPYVISAPEVVREIIEGLTAAGIRHKDIVVFDRYKTMFFKAGFDKWWPEDVRISWATDYSDPPQQRIDGYDPDHWMDMQLTLPGFSYDDERARRSYA